MQMHVLPNSRLKLMRFVQENLHFWGTLKAGDPYIKRFIPLIFRNSTRFDSFPLVRIRYSSPVCRNCDKLIEDFEREGRV